VHLKISECVSKLGIFVSAGIAFAQSFEKFRKGWLDQFLIALDHVKPATTFMC
jgi:hypothetical protein